MEEIAKVLNPEDAEYLRMIPQNDTIDFSRVSGYTKPSNDKDLIKFAKESGAKYVMSTSTVSGALTQMYFIFSSFRSPDFQLLSSEYENEPRFYMVSQRKPVTNIVTRIGGKGSNMYAMDSDSGLFKNQENVLMKLGKVVERQLTLTKDEFEKNFVKGKIPEGQPLIDDEHYRYMKLNNNICLRSQIDTTMKLEDGSDIVFEIKTRGAAPIRYDLQNYEEYLDYEINKYRGIHSSYEREYYDLIRGGFIKYCFQLKIGNQSGAFVSYHNTVENFGFEYISTEEIEKRIFGSSTYADLVFVTCSKLLTNLTDHILEHNKNEDFQTMRLGFYADNQTDKMVAFAELFYDIDKWDEEMMVEQTEDIKDEMDYYEKAWKGGRRKVLKYSYSVYVYINGVLQTNSKYNLLPQDQVEVKYHIEDEGVADHMDYMNFLHESFNMTAMSHEYSYLGAWMGEDKMDEMTEQ